MRIIPLRGAGTALLKCPIPACGLVYLPTALAQQGCCPGCGHDRLVQLASTPDHALEPARFEPPTAATGQARR
ncbi:hypothetical protein [Streptomyces inhibens]|uniref:hypothetical protein n=1 Tax=Streptomyces inhibens TaxID=2293571 RepID=UPI001EE77472|nr:hypothetical protein [Streptomyces inhibens]UKY48550.1 hypothetical protein KI385_06895 [Streptomyces inhibens]